ncbi:MAG TPA: hypothetical protein ENI15_01840 [Spirochaetes bacterium]|nr:hypothetical protein [Spirochaetota bacterium]
MRLYLINPYNTVQRTIHSKDNRLFRYFIWKPLGLLVLAGLTTSEWDIEVIDEDLGPVDYTSMPRPDLVGITAFTSQAARAYEIAAGFRSRGIPVVMGGIHTSMCVEKTMERVDSVLTGEAEAISVQFMTPLPGTRLWENMKSEGRIIANHFPEDWKYYTLTHPVANYKNLSWPEIRKEMNACYKDFYSYMHILQRGINVLLRTKKIGRMLILFLTSIGFRMEIKCERNRVPEVRIENVV